MNSDRFLVRAKPIDEEGFSHCIIYGNYYDECVEKDRAEPQVCDDKEEVER